jgi:hypothetical protein
VASITYSLTYALNNKKRIKQIEALDNNSNGNKLKSPGGSWKMDRKNSMESLLDLEGKEEGEDDSSEDVRVGGRYAIGLGGRNQLVQNKSDIGLLRQKNTESSSHHMIENDRSSFNYSVNSGMEARV